jgi:hypothetical protein
VEGGFRLACSANKPVALHPRPGAAGFFSKTLGHICEAHSEGIELFETTPFHSALLSQLDWAGARDGRFITDESHGSGGDKP